jgi:hypothetical protein
MANAAPRAMPAGPGAVRPPSERGFYPALVVLMSGIVLAGFWPYFAGLASGGAQLHWAIHLHAAISCGWLALLLTQVLLVFRRRIATHRRLGRFGIGFGVLVLLMGVVISFLAPALHVLAGRWALDAAAGFLILPTVDVLLFAGFFAAGIVHRARRELHKRLMLLATIALVFPAAARLAWDFGPWVMLFAWLLPLLLAMAHDLVTKRRVEPVYFVGLTIFIVAFARIGLVESEAWRGVGRVMLLWVLPAGFEST